MKSKFEPNPNLHAELTNEIIGDTMVAAGKAITANIKRNLPKGHFGGRTVQTYDLKKFVSGVKNRSSDNAYVEAGTKWEVANIIEWGSVNSPAYGVLRKSALQTGMQFTSQASG